MAAIVSPCINVCALDPASGLCMGCGRTGNEIAAWISFSDDERARIMAQLPQRMATLKERGKAIDKARGIS
jgi:predicted Fe-S protein YdhL (DUF1289 family)